MTPPPEITIDDFVRFLQDSLFSNTEGQTEEELVAWLEKNGLSRELLDHIGDALVDNFIYRLLHDPIPILNIIVYNVSLMGFQLGWEASREFGQRTTIG